MAKALLKIQRYFRRKPVRFFSLILLYLTAGSLVFLHSGFVGDSGPVGRGSRDSVAVVETGSRTSSSDSRRLGIMGRVFKETRKSSRRYGPPWMKKTGREGREKAVRGGDYTSNWNRALKGRNAKDMDDGRGGLNQDYMLHHAVAGKVISVWQFPKFNIRDLSAPLTHLKFQNGLVNYKRQELARDRKD